MERTGRKEDLGERCGVSAKGGGGIGSQEGRGGRMGSVSQRDQIGSEGG